MSVANYGDYSENQPLQTPLEFRSVQVLVLDFKALNVLQTEESVTDPKSQT
jgi:hypothetical protein